MEKLQSRPVILVVDDQPQNLKILGEILSYDYELIIANNGITALKAMFLSKPDLVLLDIMMPEMDGFEVIREIKKNEQYRGIPVVFLSAKDQPEDILKGFELGAVDYITKPFNQKEVLVRVKSHIELYQIRNELHTTNKNKDDLIAVLANDLKNHILSALGLSDLLVRTEDISNDKRKKYIRHIHSSSESTYALLMDLIHWSKLQNNRFVLNFKDTNLVSLLENNIEQLQTKLQEKNIMIEKDYPDKILFTADEEKMNVVLRNLLDNAIKFSPIDGQVRIFANNDKGIINCSIADMGKGMKEETLKKLFSQPHINASDDVAMYHGTGLGMWLCQKFIRLQKGEINVESNSDKGTTISFSMPDQQEK